MCGTNGGTKLNRELGMEHKLDGFPSLNFDVVGHFRTETTNAFDSFLCPWCWSFVFYSYSMTDLLTHSLFQ